MTNVFIFTAGNADARRHLRETIERPIPSDKVLPRFPSDLRESVKRLARDDDFYVWDTVPGPQNIPRWESMTAGDWVLCVFQKNGYRFVARVLAYGRDLPPLARERHA